MGKNSKKVMKSAKFECSIEEGFIPSTNLRLRIVWSCGATAILKNAFVSISRERLVGQKTRKDFLDWKLINLSFSVTSFFSRSYNFRVTVPQIVCFLIF